MMERVTLVRDRNGMFIDTVDSYYVSLSRRCGSPTVVGDRRTTGSARR